MEGKYVYVIYDPLYERTVCVHDEPEKECEICEPIRKERDAEYYYICCYKQFHNLIFLIMKEDKLLKAIEIYIRETSNKYGISLIKKLNDYIYQINDREVNINTNSIGYTDIE